MKLASFFLRVRVNLVGKEDADDVEAVEAAKVNGNENGNEVRQKPPKKRRSVILCNSLVLRENRSSLTPENTTSFFPFVEEQAGTKKKAKKPLDEKTWLC